MSSGYAALHSLSGDTHMVAQVGRTPTELRGSLSPVILDAGGSRTFIKTPPLLIAASTFALAASALADVPAETIPPAPLPAEAPAAAEVPEVPPSPVVEEAPAYAPPTDAAPLEAPAVEAPTAAAAVVPDDVVSTSRPAAAAPRAREATAAHAVGSGQAEPDCVVTAADGSCALPSTDCDILGDEGDNELFGTPDGEIICGLGGNDVLEGGDGDDTLVGGPGADRYSGGNGRDCFLTDADDELPPPEPGRENEAELPDREGTYPGECDRQYGGPLPPTDTGPEPTGTGDVANVGALYVALTRYAGGQASAKPTGAIATIATRAVKYSDGEIRFLVTCSREGQVTVALYALQRDGGRVRLGDETFQCAGEGDDPLVSVPVTAQSRRLIERSTRLRIQAELTEGAGGTGGSRQTFVLSP